MAKTKPNFYQLYVEFHKVQYWDHFCSYFMLNFRNALKILDSIMFADDTNLFFSNCDIPVLFATVNSELSKINQFFLANKLSLNVTKAKYSFFHKTSKKDDIPLKLPRFRKNSVNQFLRVLLDENLLWKDHIKFTKNKISYSMEIS